MMRSLLKDLKFKMIPQFSNLNVRKKGVPLTRQENTGRKRTEKMKGQVSFNMLVVENPMVFSQQVDNCFASYGMNWDKVEMQESATCRHL
jgi:hypothetical protein